MSSHPECSVSPGLAALQVAGGGPPRAAHASRQVNDSCPVCRVSLQAGCDLRSLFPEREPLEPGGVTRGEGFFLNACLAGKPRFGHATGSKPGFLLAP